MAQGHAAPGGQRGIGGRARAARERIASVYRILAEEAPRPIKRSGSGLSVIVPLVVSIGVIGAVAHMGETLKATMTTSMSPGQAVRQAAISMGADQERADLAERAGAGDVTAQREIGMALRDGRGIWIDEEKVKEWLQRAVAAGDAAAERELGFLYFRSSGPLHDERKAAELFRAAAASDPASASALASLHARGKGVPQDMVAARRLFDQAAHAGFAPAQARLGVMLLTGAGGLRSTPRRRSPGSRPRRSKAIPTG